MQVVERHRFHVAIDSSQYQHQQNQMILSHPDIKLLVRQNWNLRLEPRLLLGVSSQREAVVNAILVRNPTMITSSLV